MKYKRSKLFWRDILDQLLEIGFLAMLFLIPLVFATIFKSYNIFHLNKIVLFKIILSFVFLLTAIREIFYPSNILNEITKLFRRYWLWPNIFIIALGISLLFSENIPLSFFGSINRQQGYLNYALYFFWFILFSFNLIIFKEREIEKEGTYKFNIIIKRLILAIVFSGSLVSLYGILQLIGIDPYNWEEIASITRRAASTLGNPNFFASWILLVIPLAFYLFYSAEKPIFKSIYFFLFLLNLTGLFTTGSRAGLISLLFSFVLFFTYLFFTHKLSTKKIIIIIFSFTLLSIGSISIFNYNNPGRISNMIDFRAGYLDERLDFYEAAISAINKKPLFGYGQENLTSIFVSYYRPDWGLRRIGQTPDRVHNLILDILMFGGICAFLAFLALYFYFFRLAYQNIKEKNQAGLSLVLALGVSAYLFSLLFGFSIPSGEIYFFSFLAILVACDYSANRIKPAERKIFIENSGRYFLLLIIFIIFFWSIYKTTRLFLADHYFAKAVLSWKAEEYYNGMDYFIKIDKLNINPINQVFYDSYSVDSIIKVYSNIQDPDLLRFFEEHIYKLAWSIPEKEPYALLAKAKAKAAIGDFLGADKLLITLENKAPFWPGVYVEKAMLYNLQKDSEKAIKAYHMALANLPDFNYSSSEYHFAIFSSLAQLYENIGDIDNAKTYYDLANQAKPYESPTSIYP
jgi:tetratricopeptide (TPR) repeat protein